MLNMTVDGSPKCEPHESIPQALMRATELSREHQLSHVTIISKGEGGDA